MDFSQLNFFVSLLGLVVSCAALIILSNTLYEQIKINRAQLRLVELEQKRYRKSVMPFFRLELVKRYEKKFIADIQLKCEVDCAYNVEVNFQFVKCEPIGHFNNLTKIDSSGTGVLKSFSVGMTEVTPVIHVDIKFSDCDGFTYSQFILLNVLSGNSNSKPPVMSNIGS